MDSTASVIVSLLLILAGGLIMGCSSLPFTGGHLQETPAPASGFSAGNVSSEPASYNNFDDAVADLNGLGFVMSTNSSGTGIRYVMGNDMDASGDASSWIFAVDTTNSTSFVTYNHNGRTIITASRWTPGPVIAIDRVLTPRQLFNYDRAIITINQSANGSLSQKLVLEEGNYTLTQSGQGSPRILIFNATTGVQIAIQG